MSDAEKTRSLLFALRRQAAIWRERADNPGGLRTVAASDAAYALETALSLVGEPSRANVKSEAPKCAMCSDRKWMSTPHDRQSGVPVYRRIPCPSCSSVAPQSSASSAAQSLASAAAQLPVSAAAQSSMSAAEQSPASSVHERSCFHETWHDGPRVPALYGSYATEVCDACGEWRTNAHARSEWKASAKLEAKCLDSDEDGNQHEWFIQQWASYQKRRTLLTSGKSAP